MNIPWKALVFLGAAGVLSIATAPVRAQDPGQEKGQKQGSSEERQIEVTVGDDLPLSPAEGEREIKVTIGDDLPLCGGDHALTLALCSPDKKVNKTKRIVIRTDGEDRPRLGVVLRFEKSSKTDPKGAYVQAVTPGSPADEAGVKVGDVITKFNGQPLGASSKVEDGQSPPAAHLVDLARKLGDGEKVSLEILRGDKTLNLDVVARKLEDKNVFTWNGDGEDFDFDFDQLKEGNFMPFQFCFGGEEWLDMELVSMNPDLGEYFGTGEGLLVVKAPESSLGIKAGDVILKVGDRKTSSPSQAFRVLQSYEAGETVPIEVVRKQKHQTLQVKIPEDGERRGEHSRTMRPPKPPAPPPPPTPVGARRG
jgi:membrane-associated protease RseP (regulator of RpoE activity)